MRIETSAPIVEMLLDHIDRDTSFRTEPATIPAANYTTLEHAAAERTALFDGSPQAVALSPDLPTNGSYVTRDLFSIPLLLTRDTDGSVRAFINACAHRGAQVVADGRGSRRRHACPYHAWTYDTGGLLVAVPDQDAFADVCVGDDGLRELPVRESSGVIWVHPDPDARIGDELTDLGPFADDLDSYDVGAHHWWRAHRFELDLNWKLVIDTFLEPYHFASLHRDTVGPLFIPNLCHAATHGPHLREVLPRRTITGLRDLPAGEWDVVPHSAIVYVLFPNTVFVMQLDHIETWRVVPHATDPSRSTCELDFYLPELPTTDSAERHWERNWKLTIDTVIDEDFAAMAGVQRGMASGAFDHQRVGANEPALAMFHAALASRVGPPRR